MEFELFWIPCRNFFAAPQIKVDDWVKRLEVGELQLDVGVVVVLSVPEIDQIVQNPQSEVVLVFSLGVKACAVLKSASVQSRSVVAIDVDGVKEVRILCVSVLFPGLLNEHEDVFRVFHPGHYQPRATCVPPGAALMQIFFKYFHWVGCKKFSLAHICPLPVNCNYGAHSSNFADYNPPGCAIVLENHFSVVLQVDFKLKQHWRQQPVGQTFEEGVPVERDDGLYCRAILGQKRPLPHSGVRRVVVGHCGGVRVKIPKLTLGHASRKIVREVQQVFDENRLVDAVGVETYFPCRFETQSFDQRKRPVDRRRLGVGRNVGAVCHGLKRVIDREISVVPVIIIIPISYSKFVTCLEFGYSPEK